jgi:hypothetical protein
MGYSPSRSHLTDNMTPNKNEGSAGESKQMHSGSGAVTDSVEHHREGVTRSEQVMHQQMFGVVGQQMPTVIDPNAQMNAIHNVPGNKALYNQGYLPHANLPQQQLHQQMNSFASPFLLHNSRFVGDFSINTTFLQEATHMINMFS